MRTVFDGNYPEADFRSVNVTLDYPMEPQNYPGIWIQFEDTDDMQKAGVNHIEVVVDDNGIQHAVTRWRFAGNLIFTASALSSTERDRLFDEVVRVLAFTGVDATKAGNFKSLIENNDLIGIVPNYDILTPSGDAATPGTPWGSNEVIYEKTVSIAIIGEFVSDYTNNVLYPLSKVIVQGYNEDQDNVDLYGATSEDSDDDDWDPSQWT